MPGREALRPARRNVRCAGRIGGRRCPQASVAVNGTFGARRQRRGAPLATRRHRNTEEPLARWRTVPLALSPSTWQETTIFLIPIEREHPTRHRSYLVYALLVVNTAVGVLTLIAGPEAVYQDYGFTPNAPSWTTLLTSMFLHGSVWHLLGNMFFLWMFGDNVEDVLGPVLFLAVYLVCGAAAAGVHLLVSSGSDLPLIGASGAISGVLGVYLVFFPKTPTDLTFFLLRWEVKTLHVTAVGAVGAWFGEQLLLAVITAVTGLDEFVGVAFWAHVGGVVAGVVLAVGLVALGYLSRYQAGEDSWHPMLGYVRSGPGTTGRTS